MNDDRRRGRFGDERLDALHGELTADVEPDLNGDREASEVSSVLHGLSWDMFSTTVQEYVNALLDEGESPSPEARQRMVAAAGRGLAYRRAGLAPLPELLATRRHDRGVAVSVVAEALEVDEDAVYRIESGHENVRTLDAARLARWAYALGADADDVALALRLALERSTSASAARAAGTGKGRHLAPIDEQLVTDVLTELTSLQS